ncbi:MAG: hypothetical protein NC390_07630 [Fusobacterium sp.]|nr:hypothetical protein [Fusobacterium sp.]
MTIQGNTLIINQICSRSGLSGTALEALRVRLSSMSEQQLQAELRRVIAGGGGGFSELDLGVTVERTAVANELPAAERLKLHEAQCKEVAIQVIDENITEAHSIFNSQHLGAISGAYDDSKGEDNKLATSNVKKVLDYQQAGMIQMIEAKNNNLTRRAYYEENKQRIKDMILTRLTVLETPSGVKFIDEYRGKYSREQLKEIIESFVERICSDANMEKLKQIQKQFVTFSTVDELNALSNFVTNAKDYNENGRDITINMHGGEGKPQKIKGPDKGLIPSYWDSAKPITFEEVYNLERGTEYSQYAVEHYTQTKAEMETVVNAFNKKQQFVDFTDNLRKEEIPADAKSQRILDGFAEFYALSEDGGREQLQKIIDKSNLPVLLDENGINLSAFTTEDAKTRALNSLLKIAAQEKEKDFETFLGGKSIEEYQASMEEAAKALLGEDNAQMLADAMKNDNMTVIQRWTGNASMVGMALTVVGGILCFTPAAPLGAAMVTVGNTVAIGGMVAKTGLGVADYATKDVQTAEELTELSKDFVMDAGGFIIGMGAGKAGMQAFSKLIDKKLVAVFGQQISAGNKAQALKTVFTNPEYLKSFMTAGGAKLGTDFMISYAGDLAMMGVLDTRDDWRSLLQANLTGVLVGMSGDVKEAAGVGKVKPNNNILRGLTSEEDVLLQRARSENPASVVEGKIRREWQRADLQTGVRDLEQPLIVADKDGKARLNLPETDEPLPVVNDEVTGLIIKGKLNETLTRRYDEMGKVFNDIISENSAEIKKLASECKNDKQKFADGVVKILAREFGLEGFEPQIKLADDMTGGAADWYNGTILIDKNITNAKKLTGIISHEFVHMLQLRDVIAQYGEAGVREMIMNDKTIPAADKEAKIQSALTNPYNKHLLESYDLQRAETGTVNDYVRRVYKEEFTNTVGTDNMEAYTNQAIEREAYNLGSNKLGDNVRGVDDVEIEQADWAVETREVHKGFVVNEDGSITMLPAGIEYSERLKNMSKEDFVEEVIKLITQNDDKITKEELNDYRNSEEAVAIYDSFKKHPDFWAELLEKNSDGTFRWSGEHKYREMYDLVNAVMDGKISETKEIMDNMRSLKSVYNYIDAAISGENVDTKLVGFSPRKIALLKQLVEDKRDDLVTDSESATPYIVRTMLSIQKDSDIDYLMKLSKNYGCTIEDGSTVLHALKTDNQRANIESLLVRTSDMKVKDLANIAQIMEYPGAKERVENILKMEDSSAKNEQLEMLANRYLLGKKEAEILTNYRLFEYNQLSIDNIRRLAYQEPEVLDRLVERKLLEASELDGEQIIRLMQFEDKGYSVYEKLQAENGLSKSDAYEILMRNYNIVNQFDELGLGRFKGLKTVDDWKELSYALYGATLDNFKARSAELAKAEHLSGEDIAELCRGISAEEWPRVVRRGLLENKNLNSGQIRTLAGINEELYSRVLELDVLEKVDSNDWLDTILRQPKAVCQRYFNLKDNLPNGLTKDKIDTQALLHLAKIPPESVENVCKFLTLECKRDFKNKLGVGEIDTLLYDFEATIAEKPEVLDKMLEFADMKILEEQGARQLNIGEIRELTQLYIPTLYPYRNDAVPMFEKTMEIITNPQRNQKNLRVSVSDADELSKFILNKAYDVESTQAERSAFVDDLLFIPERGSEQLSPSFVQQLARDFRTADRLAEYKEFLFSAARKNAGAKQLTSDELSDLFADFADRRIDVEQCKKLLFVEERGEQQFTGKDLQKLVELSAEKLAKIEKYYHVDGRNVQFSGFDLNRFASLDEAQFARLDRLLALENSDNIKGATLKSACQNLDDVQFENFMNLKSEYPNADSGTLSSMAKLKGQELEQGRILFRLNKGLSSEQIVRMARLQPASFDRVVGYLEAGKRPDIAEALAKSDDVKIEEKYDKAIADAKAKRNQLKSGLTDLTDENIDIFFAQHAPAIITTIDMLGLPTFTHSYTSKLNGVEKLAKTVQTLQYRLSAEDFARLKQNLADKSIEPQDKIAKLQAIGSLREHLTEAELKEYIDLIKPNTPTKAETKLAKEIWANPKARFDDKFAQFCETFGIDPTNKKVIDFFEKRASVNAKGYKILNGIKENEVAKLLEIEVVRKRNLREWNEALDKKIFETINVSYSPELSAKLHLTDNKYLEQILSANDAFKDNFGELVDELVAHPDMSIRDAFNQMPHNLETRRQFEEFGINYDKWVDADVNSYRSVKVSTNAEKTKQAAIENLEADFNDPAFKAIPQAETKKIFDALEQLGIKVITKQEPQYDIDGFITGYKDVSRLYENDAPIEFARLPKVISAIKKVMNENDFWTKSSNDTALNQNIETVYNHIMKLRDAEITNAAKLKDDEVTDIEVHKTDMNNVAHSLFLGNHGACCTAVGSGCNQFAAPRYSMDKCISAIEVMDGKDFVGNTMCYFAKVDGELALVLDNIELNGKYQFNDKIRDTFMDYAKQLCEEVGKPDIAIYAGPYRHKLNMTPYETAQHDITIIGSTGGDATYIDFVTGRYVIDGQRVSNVNLFKIR